MAKSGETEPSLRAQTTDSESHPVALVNARHREVSDDTSSWVALLMKFFRIRYTENLPADLCIPGRQSIAACFVKDDDIFPFQHGRTATVTRLRRMKATFKLSYCFFVCGSDEGIQTMMKTTTESPELASVVYCNRIEYAVKFLRALDRLRCPERAQEATAQMELLETQMMSRESIINVLRAIDIEPVECELFLNCFGSLANIAQLTLDEILEGSPINRETASRVVAFFHPQEAPRTGELVSDYDRTADFMSPIHPIDSGSPGIQGLTSCEAEQRGINQKSMERMTEDAEYSKGWPRDDSMNEQGQYYGPTMPAMASTYCEREGGYLPTSHPISSSSSFVLRQPPNVTFPGHVRTTNEKHHIGRSQGPLPLPAATTTPWCQTDGTSLPIPRMQSFPPPLYTDYRSSAVSIVGFAPSSTAQHTRFAFSNLNPQGTNPPWTGERREMEGRGVARGNGGGIGIETHTEWRPSPTHPNPSSIHETGPFVNPYLHQYDPCDHHYEGKNHVTPYPYSYAGPPTATPAQEPDVSGHASAKELFQKWAQQMSTPFSVPKTTGLRDLGVTGNTYRIHGGGTHQPQVHQPQDHQRMRWKGNFFRK